MAHAFVLERFGVLAERGGRLLSQWMEEREYDSAEQLKGSVSQRSIADPAAFEHGNYMRTLQSYSSSPR